jgi:hypothetical protein
VAVLRSPFSEHVFKPARWILPFQLCIFVSLRLCVEFVTRLLLLLNRLHDHFHEAQTGMDKFLEGRVAKIDHAAFLHEPFGRPAIGDGHQYAVRFKMRRIDGHADTRPERVEPRGRGEFIGIEWPPVGHQFSAVFLPVPRSESLLRQYFGRFRMRSLSPCKNKRTAPKQENGWSKGRLFHRELF